MGPFDRSRRRFATAPSSANSWTSLWPSRLSPGHPADFIPSRLIPMTKSSISTSGARSLGRFTARTYHAGAIPRQACNC